MSTNRPRLLSKADTKRELGNIGETTLFKLLKCGDLERVKIGKKLCVTRESLDRYIDRLRGKAAA